MIDVSEADPQALNALRTTLLIRLSRLDTTCHHRRGQSWALLEEGKGRKRIDPGHTPIAHDHDDDDGDISTIL